MLLGEILQGLVYHDFMIALKEFAIRLAAKHFPAFVINQVSNRFPAVHTFPAIRLPIAKLVEIMAFAVFFLHGVSLRQTLCGGP